MRLHHLAAALPLLILAAAPIHIHDGDSLRLEGERTRLWAIDAPELRQTCTIAGADAPIGVLARDALIAIVGDGPVACDPVDVDRYGRIVSLCRVDGVDIGGELVREGWAWEEPRFTDGSYADEEAEARAAHRGIWAGDCEPPWDWRRR